jgi:hypothetical protein
VGRRGGQSVGKWLRRWWRPAGNRPLTPDPARTRHSRLGRPRATH